MITQWFKKTATYGFIACALTACSSMNGDAWNGTWNVTDTRGQAYVITLTTDGQARASGSQNAFGVWSLEDGKAYIVWNTGWKAILFTDANGQKMKSAFTPNRGFNETPADTSPISKR